MSASTPSNSARKYFLILRIYLRVVSATFLLVCFSSLKERICETWKNVFYFTTKALFILEKMKF